MSTEAWKEEHIALVCSVCTDKGPAVVGDESLARTEATARGWVVIGRNITVRTPVLSGSCAQACQAQAFLGSGVHHISFEEKREFDHRGVCPACARDIAAMLANKQAT